MAESLVNTDDVLAKLNDNHVFADVIHGIIVEPHVAGYPDDEKQIGIHAVTPIQLKFASGQSLEDFLQASRTQGSESAYRIGEELVDFRPHIAERIATSGQYIDVTSLNVEQIALLAESELNARFALGMLFENDAFNDAFLGRDDVPELDARFSSQRLFEDGIALFNPERNILVAFEQSDSFMPAHIIVAQMDFDKLPGLVGQFSTVEDAMHHGFSFAETFPMLCVDETNRVGDLVGWVALKDAGFESVTNMELGKFIEKYADKANVTQHDAEPARKFDEDKVWEQHLAAKEGAQRRVIAVAVGTRFAVVPESDVEHIDLRRTGTFVEADGSIHTLFKGTTFEESQKVDAVLDEHGDMAIGEHRVPDQERSAEPKHESAAQCMARKQAEASNRNEHDFGKQDIERNEDAR